MRQIFKRKYGTCRKMNTILEKKCRNLKKKCSKKTTFWIFLLHKSDSFCVSPLFEKHHLESGILQCVVLEIKKFTKSHSCCSNILQCVRIWTKTVTTFQKMQCKNLKRFRNWKNAFKKSLFVLFYIVKTS